MKIKHTEVKLVGSYYTWLYLWLMLPDFYTFWEKLGERDKYYLQRCWEKKELEEINKFLEGYRLSLCRGVIRIAAKGKSSNKKFSWTGFRKRIFGIWTVLNFPHPKKQTRDVPISRTNHFLNLLQIPSESPPIQFLKDYITIYILRRDHGKNF